MGMWTPLLLWVAVVGGHAATEDGGTVAYFPFDGSTTEVVSGVTPTLPAGLGYVEGLQGQSLACDFQTLELPSRPELQLQPGLTVDCWVYFDQQPAGWHTIVYKEGEYQLRLDPTHEGGRFSFFVFLKNWEPRVSVTVPEVGKWYHLVARWTGAQLCLDVNNQRAVLDRGGVAEPTESPLLIGQMAGRLDELRILNPRLVAQREVIRLAGATAEAESIPRDNFGAEAGWPGWQPILGARAVEEKGVLRVICPDPAGSVVNAALNLDVTRRPYVSLEIESPFPRRAALLFLTDKGYGEVALLAGGDRRISIVNMAYDRAWIGRLRALGLYFIDGDPNEARLKRLWVADTPRGRPRLYVRSLAPGRAILRAGREETVVATVRNLGAAAEEVRAQLEVPDGVEVLGPAVRELGLVDYNGITTVTWGVRAAQPLRGAATVRLTAADDAPPPATLDLEFRPDLQLPRADYVPPPRPVTPMVLTLMHYCPLWKLGTHYGWNKIEPWPERRPALGWYDEGTPEVADWHIKYALEHGIQGFIYCWYRANTEPQITHTLGHALEDGMMKARYMDQFKFCIMWENGCGAGTTGPQDLLENLLPYWLDHYFTHPSYLKIDNKPVLFIWVPGKCSSELGGSEATRQTFEQMRARCRERGLDGLIIIGCVSNVNRQLLEQMGREGWDASSAYGLWGASSEPPGRDMEGIETVSHASSLAGQRDIWLGKKAVGALPDIVDVMVGWDPRPWHEERTTSYLADVRAENFRAACLAARQVIETTPGDGLDKRVIVFDNWNEFGEGHYIEPCTGLGFGMVDAIREVFCPDAGPCEDIVPEDVGLDPPEHAYLRWREIMFANWWRPKRPAADGLVAWWSFDEDDEQVARDAGPCNFLAAKEGFQAVPGVVGKAFRCTGGSVALASHELFFPLTGLTVELWYKTDVAGQSDRWMLNTIETADSGYRLGLDGGRLTWQIPQGDWTHALSCPEPAPLGRWVHVAATYDNETLRLYVDGEERAAMQRGGPIRPAHGRLCIGNYMPGHSRAWFDGALDEVKLYNRALSPEEIREHATAGKGSGGAQAGS